LVEARAMSERKRKRIWCMLNAYLTFHAKKLPRVARENTCWYLLLVWASLGGTQDEVIRG
jgi:hypothetical protein